MTLEKQTDEKFCFECGAVIKQKAEICPKCGVRQLQAPANSVPLLAPNGKSKLAAGLLGIFVGGLGIHKFYLGRIGWGIIYLLFCWTFIPAIVGFIEGIVYLTMRDQAFIAKYGMN